MRQTYASRSGVQWGLGQVVEIYTDTACTTPAAIADMNGTVIAGSQLTCDSQGLPAFQGPDGWVATLYAKNVGAQSGVAIPLNGSAKDTEAARSVVISVANPAPGAGLSTTSVPPGVIWILKSVFYQLQTDTNAANRQATVLVKDDQGHTLYQVPDPSVQPASNTWQHSFVSGLGYAQVQTGGVLYAPLPIDYEMREGYEIEVNVSSIQATDQVSGITICVEQIPVS